MLALTGIHMPTAVLSILLMKDPLEVSPEEEKSKRTSLSGKR